MSRCIHVYSFVARNHGGIPFSGVCPFIFPLFFQQKFLIHSSRPDKDIDFFVHLYFQRHIRKRFEKDLLCCLVKVFSDLVPQSVRRPVTILHPGRLL